MGNGHPAIIVAASDRTIARTTVEEPLEEYDRRHRELAAQIAEIKMVCSGKRYSPLHPLHISGLPVQR